MTDCSDCSFAQLNPDSEKHFYGAAHVGVAWSTINIEKSQSRQSKHESVDTLKQALDILTTEMALINSVQVILGNASSASGGGFNQSDLDSQLNVRTTILGSYMNSVQQCMRAVNKSLRLTDVLCVDVASGTSQLFVGIDRDYNIDSVLWQRVKNTSHMRYHVTFNDLTVHKDAGDQDQAVITIDNAYTKDGKASKIKSAFSSAHLKTNYRGFQLRLNQIGLSRVRALLSENKEFNDELTAESAIDQLMKNRTVLNAMGVTNSYGVDLTIVSPDARREIMPNIQVNEAISIISKNKLQNDKLRYNFTIKKASVNELNSCFWSTEQSKPTFQVSFDGLDSGRAAKLVQVFKASSASVDVEMTATKADILSIFNVKNDDNADPFSDSDIFRFSFLCNEADRKYRKVSRGELMEESNKLQTDEKPMALKVGLTLLSFNSYSKST